MNNQINVFNLNMIFKCPCICKTCIWSRTCKYLSFKTKCLATFLKIYLDWDQKHMSCLSQKKQWPAIWLTYLAKRVSSIPRPDVLIAINGKLTYGHSHFNLPQILSRSFRFLSLQLNVWTLVINRYCTKKRKLNANDDVRKGL